MVDLITEHIASWTSAQIPKTNGGRGRSRGSNRQNSHGIKKLRELILELAVRGKLMPQDPNDEPASVLLEKIAKEKARLIKEGVIKKQKSLPKIIDDEKPFELPVGWEWVRLANYFDVRDGTHDSPKPQSNGFPLVTSKNLSSGKLDISNVTYLSEEDHLKIIERSKVDKWDVLFAMIGSIGNPVIVDLDEEFSIKNVALFKYYIPQLSVPRYLKIFLELAAVEMRVKAAGGVQPFVSLGTLRAFTMAVPPLAEQHRIVAKVDELMALCDKLERQQTASNDTHQILVETLLATLTTIADPTEFAQGWQLIANHFDTLFTTEESIDQLKQTILQLAVMGKLVLQDPNDEPASVLLEKISKEKARLIRDGKIRKQNSLPEISESEKLFELKEGWEWARLGDFTIVGTGATPSRENSKYFFPAEINWLTSGETSDDLIVDTRERISPLAVSETNITVYPIGTLIVAMYGQGKTRGQISELLIQAGTNQACAAIQPVSIEVHHRKYIKLFFKKAYEEIRSHAAGGAQPNLNVGKVTKTVVPLPPLAEQHRIVAKVDELMALCDNLKKRLYDAETTQIHLANTIVEQAVA